MENRELGKSGLFIHPFVFGGNVFGWTVDLKTSFNLLDTFVDVGFNCVDTADVYSYWVPGHTGGESETIIGKWLKQGGRRDKIILATKLGKPMGEGKRGLSKAYITQAVEDSLRRLQTDYIDLYQSHEDDPQTPLTETLETFTDLIKQGKVRAIGASNFSAQRLRESLQVSKDHGLARYESLQPEYNLYDRQGYETEYEALFHENSIGVISYYSLASGFLTGKYRSENDLGKSQRGGGVKKYLNKRGYAILAALDKVAQEYNTTPAAVALAWLIKRPGITGPIASATSIQQLKDISKAAELSLDAKAIELLTTASTY